MFHPWRMLRGLPQITVNWEKLNYKVGISNGVDEIRLEKRLNQVERRCAVTHEMVHIERGHATCQGTPAEIGVRVETARRLIAFEDLIEHSRWARSFYELADELWVTQQVLSDRINYLTKDEELVFNTIDEDAAC